MNKILKKQSVLLIMLLWFLPFRLEAAITGLEGNTFNLTAKADYIDTGEGNRLLFWGYANADASAQYPGPTLIVNQGDSITINLGNELDVPVSIVFPGQENVEAIGAASGLLTREALPGEAVSYSFIASHAGTYLYHSGSRPELQVEMGLVGALIVRPYGYDEQAPTAYEHPDSAYDREYLFLMTEMDPRIHNTVQFEGVAALDGTDYLTDYSPTYWFFNGRNFPDTLLSNNVPWLPSQPYTSLVLMYPGERVLKRIICAGRDLHPHHTHGNNIQTIAKDGRLLASAPGSGADISYSEYTLQAVPGETADAIFTWTGKKMGWDIYGTGEGFEHDCVDTNGDDFDDTTWEYCPDHEKPFPVVLPEAQSVVFGGLYSGSPFLGLAGNLPPGEGGLNPFGAYAYPWHSHAEKELTNYNVFIGGMLTLLFILPPE